MAGGLFRMCYKRPTCMFAVWPVLKMQRGDISLPATAAAPAQGGGLPPTGAAGRGVRSVRARFAYVRRAFRVRLTYV